MEVELSEMKYMLDTYILMLGLCVGEYKSRCEDKKSTLYVLFRIFLAHPDSMIFIVQ